MKQEKRHYEQSAAVQSVETKDIHVGQTPHPTLRATFSRHWGAGKNGFTLAEVLITLGIIGVVAAMTLPTLINSYKKQETIAKLQKTYSVLNQALKRSEVDNESFDYWQLASDMGPGAYFEKYWKPYFVISRVCNTYQECGYNSLTPWPFLNGQQGGLNVVNTTLRSTFYTQDGVLIAISGFTGSADINNGGTVDIRIYIDLNGPQKPNQYGKDFFVFVRTKKGIMPYGFEQTENIVKQNCSATNTGEYCAAKIAKDGWKIKEDYPY